MNKPNIRVTPITHNLKKITLKNDFLTVVLLNYGARLHQIFAPDKDGNVENILLSYDNYEDVLADKSFFGATVGPVAGRIRDGKWKNHQLEKNNSTHHIHGGTNGWSFQYWDIEIFEEPDAIGVVFYLKDTFSGYPGPIKATVTYRLQNNQLEMTTKTTSNVTTITNPTNHAYFNLSGNGQRDILTHSLTLNTLGMLELDSDKLPTGNLLEESDLCINFKKKNLLKQILDAYPVGLDDVFLLRSPKLTKPSLLLEEKQSGRQMAVATSNKSVVLFSTTGFHADFKLNGQKMHSNYGLAIEPQEVPDIVHFPEWGSITLHPGQERVTQTIYQFMTTS